MLKAAKHKHKRKQSNKTPLRKPTLPDKPHTHTQVQTRAEKAAKTGSGAGSDSVNDSFRRHRAKRTHTNAGKGGKEHPSTCCGYAKTGITRRRPLTAFSAAGEPETSHRRRKCTDVAAGTARCGTEGWEARHRRPTGRTVQTRAQRQNKQRPKAPTFQSNTHRETQRDTHTSPTHCCSSAECCLASPSQRNGGKRTAPSGSPDKFRGVK